MHIEVFPVVFEAYLDQEGVFSVTAFDECSAEVDIKGPINVAVWDAIAPKIRDCLLAMQLGAPTTQAHGETHAP